jgi:hypothetical protein
MASGVGGRRGNRSRRGPATGLAGLAALLVLLGTGAPAGAVAAPPVPPGGSALWTVLDTPAVPGGVDQTFDGVSCATPSTCLAVGRVAGVVETSPIAETWQNGAWQPMVTLPAGASVDATLDAVSCGAPRFCAAVGQQTAGLTPAVLVEEWTGASWSPVPAPDVPGAADVLRAVSCTSAAWCVAVGSTTLGTSPSAALIEIWDGSAWQIVPGADDSANAPDADQLDAVSCVSDRQCVAVGERVGTGGTGPLAENWNGATWSLSPVTDPGLAGGTDLTGVSCPTPSMCMAVGAAPSLAATGTSVVEVDDASGWTVVPAPLTPFGEALTDVSCASPDDCDVVGDEGALLPYPPYATGTLDTFPLVSVWNGAAFTVDLARDDSVVDPGDPTDGTFVDTPLSAVACPLPGHCMAVGSWGAVGGVPDGVFAEASPALLAATGYVMVDRAGDLYNFDTQPAAPPAGLDIRHPVVGIAATGDDLGDWIADAGGDVYALGDAGFSGSMGGARLNAPVVGIAATPDGHGYWLAGADGAVYSFGDAAFFGSLGAETLNRPIIAIAATPDGRGYWLVASDGGVFAFGDAGFYGSMGGRPLAAPVVAVAATPDGHGYWLVASDGGVFAFGDAGFFGSTGGIRLAAPICGVLSSADGAGYLLVASDGGVFAFGDALFAGSLPGRAVVPGAAVTAVASG